MVAFSLTMQLVAMWFETGFNRFCFW